MIEIKTLCISGGGVKGIAYCGVFEKLQELQMTKQIQLDIQKICCVSAGCLFGLIYALGYKFAEIKEELLNKNFREFKDVRLKNFFTGYGLDSGKNIISWIETLIIKKGHSKDLTFKQLYEATGLNFQVVATNLETYEYTIFDWTRHPNMIITKAIRLSISIPFLFTAETYNGEVYVDGGVLNSYPIECVMDDIDTVLGFRLLSYKSPKKKTIQDLEGFVSNLVTCSLYQREKTGHSSESVRRRTIYIDTNISNSINFDMNRIEKEKLIQIGYEATENYFDELCKKNINRDVRVQ
jgi:NTE family protein